MKTTYLTILFFFIIHNINGQKTPGNLKTITKEQYKDYFMSDIQDVRLAVNEGNNNDIVCILPSNEENKILQKELNDYYFINFINGLHLNHPKPKCKVITDVEALQTDLSNTNIRTFGTVKGNLWTAWFLENVKDFPIKIYNDSIVADTVYRGSNYVVSAVWYNPFNVKYGVILNTPQNVNYYKFPIGRELTQFKIFQNSVVVSKCHYYHLINNSWIFSAKRDTVLEYKIAIGNQRMKEM